MSVLLSATQAMTAGVVSNVDVKIGNAAVTMLPPSELIIAPRRTITVAIVRCREDINVVRLLPAVTAMFRLPTDVVGGRSAYFSPT